MSDKDEAVGDKLDRLTFVLNQFISDLDDNPAHGARMSMISSVHQSFCENSIINTEEDTDAVYIPQDFLEKFQECLTDIDRLNMKLEDFRSDYIERSHEKSEIFLTVCQIKDLHHYLGDLLQKNTQHALFKLNKASFETCDFQLACQDTQEKLTCLEIENLRLKAENFDFCSQDSSFSRHKSVDSRDLFFKHLEMQKQMLSFKQKEQELDRIHEEYGLKMVRVEILINEYQSKIEEINKQKPREGTRKHPSQDFTRTRTPVPLGNPLSTSCFINDLINTRQEIQTKIANIEKLIKQKYKKNKKKEENESGMTLIEEYRYRDATFLQGLGQITNFQQKEKFILGYLKESREYLHGKIEYLQRYESFLIDNWIKVNGEPSGIEAVKKASSTLFHKIYELKKEKEVVDEKHLRINRIKESIKKETAKLQEHRKKILVERQNLQKHQGKIENYLKNLATLNNLY